MVKPRLKLLLLSLKVMAVGKPVAVARKVRFWPTRNVVLSALVIVGASLTVSVKLWVEEAELSLLAAFFGLMGTALFAFAELFYFAPLLIMRGAGYLQTFSPDHYAIQAAARHDYRAFYIQEIRFRSEAGYPPFSRLANCHRGLPDVTLGPIQLSSWLPSSSVS